MAFEVSRITEVQSEEDDFCLPGLELQHELLLTLRNWASAAGIVADLSNAGADLLSLSVNPQAGAFVLKCRFRSISAARARAFVRGLSVLAAGAACVEHVILGKAPEHARP